MLRELALSVEVTLVEIDSFLLLPDLEFTNCGELFPFVDCGIMVCDCFGFVDALPPALDAFAEAATIVADRARSASSACEKGTPAMSVGPS